MIPHETAPQLRNPHGFFGRRGGVSMGPYTSLNCGLGSDDHTQNVRENRERVRGQIGADDLQTCHQVHSATALFIDTPLEHRPKADGLVTMTPGLALGALHADCTPVLLEADGMVGACHAGWRGAVSGITEATVALMRQHGAREIRAVIGPTISLESYEVGEDFRESALAQSPDSEAFFHDAPRARPQNDRPWIGDRLHFDLPAFVQHRLETQDVEVTRLELCTYAAPTRYFSYRYNAHHGLGDYGRNISAIALRP